MTEITGKPIRQDIINAVYATIDGMLEDVQIVPVPTPPAVFGRLWNQVVFGPLDQVGNQSLPAVGIDPGPDKIILTEMFQTQKTFIITINFVFPIDVIGTMDSYETFEYYLGRLIAVLLLEQSPGGAIQVREAGAGSEIEGRGDSRPGGYFLLEVVYRHARTDPTRRP